MEALLGGISLDPNELFDIEAPALDDVETLEDYKVSLILELNRTGNLDLAEDVLEALQEAAADINLS